MHILTCKQQEVGLDRVQTKMIGVLSSQSISRVENPRHPVKRKRYFTRLGQGQTNIDTQKGDRNKPSLANYQ